jgi:hypothetical protein
MKKSRIVTLGISGGGSLTGPFTRRPPISLYTMVPRTGGYAYAAKVWDLSIIQGPVSVAPCQTRSRFATFASLHVGKLFVYRPGLCQCRFRIRLDTPVLGPKSPNLASL